MSTATPPPLATSTAPTVKPRRRWRRRLIGLVVIVGLLVGLAPMLVARTALRDHLARKALSGVDGTVTVGSASLGWWSGVELRDVTVTDTQGQPVLSVALITSDRSLLGLARNSADPGVFHVDGLVLHVTSEKDITNLETVFATFLKDDHSPPSPSRIPVTIQVTNGTVRLKDADRGDKTEFTSLAATVEIPADRGLPVRVALSLTAASAGAGSLSSEIEIGPRSQVKLQARNFPVAWTGPFVRRGRAGTDLSGLLTADVAADWSGKGDALMVHAGGTIATKSLVVSELGISKDRLTLATAELPFQIGFEGGRLNVERFALSCDVGTLSASGSVTPTGPMADHLDTAGIKLDANIDLARLAALMPNLLRIHPGSEVREGKLTVHLASTASPSGTIWSGEVRSSALKANRDGKEIAWEQPFDIEFAGHLPAQGLPTFDKLVCRSDFVALNAKGSADSFRAAANVSLDKLAMHLSQFVDFGGHQLAGDGLVQVVASRKPDGHFKADGSVSLKNVVYADASGRGIKEPDFKLTVAATGKNDVAGMSLATGKLNLHFGTDSLETVLVEPIADCKRCAGGSASLTLMGDLGRWRNRVGGLVHIPAYTIGGAATITATVRLDDNQIKLQTLTMKIEKARFKGAGLDLDEPTLNANGMAVIDRVKGTATLSGLTITCPTVTFQGGRLAFDSAGGDIGVSGGAEAITDLNRLGRTLHLQSDPKGRDALHGRAGGQITFGTQAGKTTFGGKLAITDFSYGLPEESGIAEKTLSLSLDGGYDDSTDTVSFSRGRIERPGLAASVAGMIQRVSTRQDVSLKGTLNYNWDLLTPELRKSFGSNFAATGSGEKPFSYIGRLGVDPRAPALASAGEFGLGWGSVRVSGADMGPGEVTARLNQDVLTCTPIAATFGGGRVAVTPTIRLDPGELTLAKGLIVDRAKLTPKVCASMVGYALPVIANATQAEGELSVNLAENRIPLGDLTHTAAAGQLIVHKATVSAGPVVSAIAELLGTQSTSVTLASDMTVPVKVENGRVYHENLKLTVNSVSAKTSGSVGFDGTLKMVVEVPVPQSILNHNPRVAKALAGRTLQVPMTGTMAKPSVDRRAFEAEVAALVRGAAKSVGKDLLKGELDKLFPQMPKK